MPLIPAFGRQRQASFCVRGQTGLQSEFQDSQDYTEKPCLKRTSKQTNKTLDTLNLIKQKVGNSLKCIVIGDNFPNRTSIDQALGSIIDKCLPIFQGDQQKGMGLCG